MADTEWLTVAEVAEMFGVTTGRIRQIIYRKQLPSALHGHVRLIKRRDAEKYQPMTGPQGGRPKGYKIRRPKDWTPPPPRVRVHSKRERKQMHYRRKERLAKKVSQPLALVTLPEPD